MERTSIEQIVRAVIARMEAEGAPAAAKALDAVPHQKPAYTGKLDEMAPPAGGCPKVIPVEISARHVHLCQEDLQKLFGTGILPSKKAISQPGQYLSEYRVRLIGPKGVLENVAVLGPVRSATQAEISATDARSMGIDAPVRLSGELNGAAMVCIQAGENMVQKPCAIIAQRHVHMTPEDAAAFQVSQGQEIALTVDGKRPLTLGGVVARVSRESALALHIDTDEANAAGAWGNTVCRLAEGCPPASQLKSAGAAAQVMPVNDQAKLDAKLVCEGDVLSLQKGGMKTLYLKKGQIITPLAIDALKARGITLIREGQG